MNFLQVKDNAESTLPSALNNSATSFSVATGEGARFPSSNFVVTIGNEKILVGTRSSDTFSSCTRGYDGTTAVSHNAGDPVCLNVISLHISQLQDNVLTKDGAVSFTNNWNMDGQNTLYLDRTNKRVGIGTASPGYALDVMEEIAGDYLVRLFNTRGESDVHGNVLYLDGNRSDTTNTILIGSRDDKFIVYSNGSAIFQNDVGIGTATPTAKLDINSNILRLRITKTPDSAEDTGNAGDICWDSNYIYICVATNAWKRVAISSW